MLREFKEEITELSIHVDSGYGDPFIVERTGKIKRYFGGFIRLRRAFATLVGALFAKFDDLEFELRVAQREINDLRKLVALLSEQVQVDRKKKNARNRR